MKRHLALEPFSRDHYAGLTLAKALSEGKPGASERCQYEWEAELKDHFFQEETLLGPLLSKDMSDHLNDDHREIEKGIEALPKNAIELGLMLTDHIRWEERVMFPWLEKNISPELLLDLASKTENVEQSRWARHPMRAEQVRRRSHQSN